MVLSILILCSILSKGSSLPELAKDQRCYNNCKCCVNEECETGIHGWTNVCTKGCIDGHRGARCYELCPYENCKSCRNGTEWEYCDACYDGYYLGPIKTCQYSCPSKCLSCVSSTSCKECKEGFYNKNGSFLCEYSDCPENCECKKGNNDCTSCQPGYYDTYSNCSNICSTNCTSCISKELCSSCEHGFYNGYENDIVSGPPMKNCSFKCRDTCTQCYSYDNCSQCVNGKYGLTCQKNCSVGCENNTCLHELGLCNCSSNFKGNKCADCQNGKYGMFCNLTCPQFCANDICGKETGLCVFGCLEGHSGDKCCVKSKTCMKCSSNTLCEKCDFGFFQKNCTEECPGNCLNSCDISTGKCTTCRKNFYGQFCNLTCSENCTLLQDSNTSKCEQSNGTCIHGCVQGLYGLTCNESCSRLCGDKTCLQGTNDCKHSCVGEKLMSECLQRSGSTSKPSSFIAPFVGAVGVFSVVAAVSFKRFRKFKKMKTSVQSSVSYRRASESQDETTGVAEEESVYSNCEKNQDGKMIYVEAEDLDMDDVVTYQQSLTEHRDLADYYNTASFSSSVKVMNLFSYVTTREADLFEKEFKQLPKPGDLAKVCKTAKRPENATLNRYNGIYPFDHTRVTIPGDPNFFINACYINGYRRQKAYIASIGPTAKTTDCFKNFWRMVWHEKSDVIVMLTNLQDKSGMKCEQYWPEAGREEQYGQVIVKCLSVEEFSEYSVRTFTISKENEQRNITQLHYTAWPDKGVPSEITSLVEFRQRVKTVPETFDSPVVVHCSSGVGKSGTYIALDILVEQGMEEDLVEVFSCVSKLRMQRVKMVQTTEQYIFLHKALVHSLLFDCEAVTVEQIQTMASETDEMFTIRFQTLQKEVDTEKEDNIVSREENGRRHQDKSRHKSDFPGDRERVRLYLNRKSGDHDFINAVFISSFKVSNFFIAAQSPLPSTTEDFLCMIYQQRVSCVIALETSVPSSKNDDVGIYLPADNETCRCGNFTVTSSMSESKPQYVLKKLFIQNSEMGKSKTVYHFQYTNWRNGQEVAENPADFVLFIKEVEKYISETDSPNIVVHCLNGYERSGLFCVVYTLLEKLKAERQVSVENIVRRVRAQRRLAISSVEQLRFCYQCVSTSLESYNTYCNYEFRKR